MTVQIEDLGLDSGIVDVKNGRASFDVTTEEPTAPAGSCPNPKWTADVTDVAFTTATITGTQDGTTVFTRTVNVT